MSAAMNTWVRTQLATELNKAKVEPVEVRKPVTNSGTAVIPAGTKWGRLYHVEADVAPGESGFLVHQAFPVNSPLTGPDDLFVSEEYYYDQDGNCLGRGVQILPVDTLVQHLDEILPNPNIPMDKLPQQAFDALLGRFDGPVNAALQRWRAENKI